MLDLIHGANPENLFKYFKIPVPDKNKILDFSTNTNIIAWPKIEIDLKFLASNYPDPDCRKLIKIISQRENLQPQNILFVNGSNEAIYLLSRIFNDHVGILQPNYSEYKRAFYSAQDFYNLNEINNFNAVIISNPNNPTGKYIPEIYNIARSNPNINFIIDEAYKDFLLNHEPEPVKNFENIIILRSLTKIFHLSGVRIGYLIADENLIFKPKMLQPSWSVNNIAQELAFKFLSDDNFYNNTQKFYKKYTPEFINLLLASGHEIIKSDVHYFLLKVDDDLNLIRKLLKFGIVVRHTRNFPGLNGKYIRIATRFPNENKLFTGILNKK